VRRQRKTGFCSSNLNSMTNSLDDSVKHSGSLNFERSPLQKALIDDAGCNWPVSSKAQVLCDTANQQLLVLLLFLIKWFLRFVICFRKVPLVQWRAMKILNNESENMSNKNCWHVSRIWQHKFYKDGNLPHAFLYPRNFDHSQFSVNWTENVRLFYSWILHKNYM